MKRNNITTLFGLELKPRVIVKPKSSVSVSTPAQRRDVMQSVQKVMDEHRDVLVALKNR
ncbi:hypothetical protein QHI69_02725 [Burkholderia gladioli pv. gladioli]|uniref:hypothetical protein n=1 Tax=Burkholderia gladioli TaxID=28095 RepID=UPI0024BCFF81|nr:hypothetical protein [Burkholderia gladioli]MDJ1160816.1 hypothetical protein [Burkholderia gladioli pv. gladioli]